MRRSMTALGVLLTVFLLVSAFQAGHVSAAAERGAGVSVGDLPQNLKGLDIKKSYIPSSRQRVGVIHSLTNQVVVIHRDTNAAYFGQAGDVIYENDALQTLVDSRCRIRFFDENVVTLAPETEFSVDSFVDQREEGRKRSLFSMAKGKAMFYAMRLFRYREMRFQLNTPTAVVGVRGTKFGVHVFEEITGQSASLGLKVADRGRDIGPYLAAAGSQGSRIVTVVAAGDGQLTANDQVLNPGDVYDTRDNLVRYDPGAMDDIERDTLVEPREDITALMPGEEEAGDDTGEEPLTTTQAGLTEEGLDIVQQQTGERVIEEQPGGLPSLSGPTDGYFAALLTDKSSPTAVTAYDAFVPVYLQPMDDSSVLAEGVNNNNAYVVHDGEANLIKSLYIPEDGEAGYLGDLNIPTGNYVIVGQAGDYLQWGYWDGSSQEISGYESGPYMFDNRAWFIEGVRVSGTWPLGQIYDYSFNTRGTFWSEGGGIPLNGSGHGTVDFYGAGGGGSLYDFTFSAMSADENNGVSVYQYYSVPIYNHQFTFSDSAADFAIKHNGEWGSGAAGRVTGSFFGSNAHLGFAWGAYCPSRQVGAVGIGQGTGAPVSENGGSRP